MGLLAFLAFLSLLPLLLSLAFLASTRGRIGGINLALNVPTSTVFRQVISRGRRDREAVNSRRVHAVKGDGSAFVAAGQTSWLASGRCQLGRAKKVRGQQPTG